MDCTRSADVLIIGAGIAGLATAAALHVQGVSRVCVVEAEGFPFCLASGNNAAIYRPLESDAVLARWAARSGELLGELQEYARAPLLARRGLLLLDQSTSSLANIARTAGEEGIDAQQLSGREQIEQACGVPLQHDGPALWGSSGGVLDPHEIGQALLRQLDDRDISVDCRKGVARLALDPAGRCCGAVLESGEVLHAGAVVLAAGAASGTFALQAASPQPLLPLQRHLAVLDVDPGCMHKDAPVVWSLRPELYFRPEAGGVLVSPCDETPAHPAQSVASLEALSPLAERFRHLLPALENARVRRYWACIRTKSVDGRPLVGPDPMVSGLHYVAGLGGFGMSCGLALAEQFAEQFVLARPIDPRTDPRRFRLPWQAGQTPNHSLSALGASPAW